MTIFFYESNQHYIYVCLGVEGSAVVLDEEVRCQWAGLS